MSRLWTSIGSGAGLAALLVIAGVVSHTAPSEERWQSPMAVSGAMGEPVIGRNLQATVLDVRLAESVTASNGWTGKTSGVWVVVDASVAAVVDEVGARLGTADLQIGGTTYSASERPDMGSIQEASLSIGIPQTGPLFFEIPRSILSTDAASAAQLQFAASDDPRLDSLLVVTVDLTSIAVVPSIETTAPTWGRS